MKKSSKIMLALATALTVSPALITTGSISAFAGESYYNTNISVQGKSVSSPKHVDANDGGNLTAFLPLYYVNQALSQYGITGSWDGNVWTINTPQSTKVDLSNLPTSKQTNSSVLAMSINGTTVQFAPRQVAGDPMNGYQSTTYLPIWYIDQVLNRLGIEASWDGVNWSLSFNGVQATLLKNVGVSGTKMIAASDGTLYVMTSNGNVVKLNASGNVEATSETNFSNNVGLSLSSDGQTLYAFGFGYFGARGFDETYYMSTGVDTFGFNTINTADMTINDDFVTGKLDQISPDGKIIYELPGDSSEALNAENSSDQTSIWNLSDPKLSNASQTAISPDGNALYIGESANGTSNILAEVNTIAQTVQTENIDSGYDGMILAPDGSTIYLTNWGSDPNITSFSTNSNSVTGSPITGSALPHNDHPDGSILALSGSMLFGVGNIDGQKAVCVVNTAQRKVEGTVFNKNFGKIEAIATSNNGNKLDVLTDNGLYIYNIQTEQ